ncbi:hypothetical protein [Mycolicibacterium sp. NCC-Tsukiji]|uniref:hypothetical protein n=1 Tax=Mycolicibacterium sp. NCC-Tsukiji TaxID=2185272 RepID=UPI000ED82E44|nr:hypothetical protein [Mycolicibacterium sp. NCC-Tsukiji]GCB01627.1 hypothetical protein NCCNTM_52610 [Mycolicibacterium sp. NCC-Tsukiji]
MNPGPVTDPHWWAQPAATLIAATIALIAAGLAWHAATSQAREASRRDRITNRIAALADAQAAALNLARTAVMFGVYGTDEEHRDFNQAYASTMVSKTKLIALGGYREVADALDSVLSAASNEKRSTAEGTSTDDDSLSDALDHLGGAIVAAVEQEDRKRLQ